MATTREIRAEVEEGVYREFKALCARRGRTVKELIGYLMAQELDRELIAREDAARALLTKIPKKRNPPPKEEI